MSTWDLGAEIAPEGVARATSSKDEEPHWIERVSLSVQFKGVGSSRKDSWFDMMVIARSSSADSDLIEIGITFHYSSLANIEVVLEVTGGDLKGKPRR